MIDLQNKYLDAVGDVLSDVDFAQLHKSCNSQDTEYAQEVLRRLHQAFVDTFGSDCIESVEDDFIEVPAVIQGKKTGEMALGLVTLDLSSSGEHWSTTYFSKLGILAPDRITISQAGKRYLKEHFSSYNYWYTPEIPGDIHVNFENLPGKVHTLLSACTGCTPTQTAEGIATHAM